SSTLLLLLLTTSLPHHHPPSFPTRRSSDLSPPLPREARRDAHLRPVPVDRVEDRLRRRDDLGARVRLGGREGREDRRAQTRAVSPRGRGRAAADRVTLPLARHLVPRYGWRPRRRRDGLPLLHP